MYTISSLLYILLSFAFFDSYIPKSDIIIYAPGPGAK
jgi:hypothetical protein